MPIFLEISFLIKKFLTIFPADYVLLGGKKFIMQ